MIKIDPEVQQLFPALRLVCFSMEVKVEGENQKLWREIEQKCNEIAGGLKTEDIATIPANFSTREAYKKMGKDPSRYRPSAEALLRRVVSGKGLYRINNVVDTLNLISVQTGFSIGGYDQDKIKGDIVLTRGKADDEYRAIGRGELNIENLPVLRDRIGCFGSPTSDSLRTMVTEQTRNFLMVFFCFDEKVLDEKGLIELVAAYFERFAHARELSMTVF